MENGIYNFDVDISELESISNLPLNFYAKLEIWIRVKTENGQTEDEFNDDCVISRKPVVLQFDEELKNTFKPNMPSITRLFVRFVLFLYYKSIFNIKKSCFLNSSNAVFELLLRKPNGTPADNVGILLRIELINSDPAIEFTTTAFNGVAVFNLPILNSD